MAIIIVRIGTGAGNSIRKVWGLLPKGPNTGIGQNRTATLISGKQFRPRTGVWMRFTRTFLGCVCLAFALPVVAQTTPSGFIDASGSLGSASDSIPDAPSPRPEVLKLAQSTSAATQPQQATADPPQSQGNRSQGNGESHSSYAQTSADQSSDEQTQYEKAQEQVKEQEKQRVGGIVPTFNVTYHRDAVPLTPGQKMNLSLHSAVDPFAFASAFLEAGYHEAANDLSGFPWGPKGFFERSGVAYLDTFDGDILGTGIVPIIFRQDPRYFRLGYGTVRHRVLYSLATNFIAKSDRSRKWQPNYGNLLGNLAAGALSNLYYPGGNSNFGLTVTNTMLQIGEGAGGSIFNEFWPDLSRRFLHKDPTHGLDAQAQAADKAARQAERNQDQRQ